MTTKRPNYRIRVIPRKRHDERPGPARISIERRFAFLFWRNVVDVNYIDDARLRIRSLALRDRIARVKPKTIAIFDSAGNEI